MPANSVPKKDGWDYATEIVSCLSTIAGLTILIFILFNKKFHTITFKLVAILTLMELTGDANFFFANLDPYTREGKYNF